MEENKNQIPERVIGTSSNLIKGVLLIIGSVALMYFTKRLLEFSGWTIHPINGSYVGPMLYWAMILLLVGTSIKLLIEGFSALLNSRNKK